MKKRRQRPDVQFCNLGAGSQSIRSSRPALATYELEALSQKRKRKMEGRMKDREGKQAGGVFRVRL